MKAILPTLTALALLTASPLARPAVESAAKPVLPATATNPAPGAESTPSSAPHKLTRWEDTGMKPTEAREWESYSFTPQDALAWKNAGFPALLARTWSDKGFDPDEAAEWRDTAKNNRTLMAELDQSDPAQWKREGFTPKDRLAWWEAGFAFDDAVILTRAGMTPADAAWHGHDKLKELKSQDDSAKSDPAVQDDASSAGEPFDLKKAWHIVSPHLKTGLIVALALVSCLLAIFLYRGRKGTAQAAPHTHIAPLDSEHAPLPTQQAQARSAPAHAHAHHDADHDAPKAARFTSSLWSSSLTCAHCQSTDVRPSRIRSRRIAGIRLNEYFRCRSCGRHFSTVRYTPLLAASLGMVLLLTIVTAGFIHLLASIP